MASVKDLIAGLRSVLLLQDQVARMAESLKARDLREAELRKEIKDLHERLIRMETRWEMLRDIAMATREPYRQLRLPPGEADS